MISKYYKLPYIIILPLLYYYILLPPSRFNVSIQDQSIFSPSEVLPPAGLSLLPPSRGAIVKDCHWSNPLKIKVNVKYNICINIE